VGSDLAVRRLLSPPPKLESLGNCQGFFFFKNNSLLCALTHIGFSHRKNVGACYAAEAFPALALQEPYPPFL
jgi:hypothetical protein